METELVGSQQLGRVNMTFCFVDLTGFTRYTEEEGDEEALDLVERFVETVEATLPSEALVVKTIGDEVMIVSPDPVTLTEWSVGFLALFAERPQPRVGIHLGRAVYRDGDYFGTDVNLTHRVVARALGGEVLVTRSVADAIGSSNYLELDPIGKVDLKGFPEPIDLFIVASEDPATRCAGSTRLRGAGRIRRPRRTFGVTKEGALETLKKAAEASGLVDPTSDAVVMVSGGPDSACAAAALAATLGPSAFTPSTSTTAFATRPTPTSRPRGACAQRSASIFRSAGRPRSTRPWQPPGRRARCPLHGGRAFSDTIRRELDRHRPYALGRRRDRCLSPRKVAGVARSPRHEPALGPRHPAPSGPVARKPARSPRPRACRSPTTRPTPIRPSPATGFVPRCCPRSTN